MGIWYRTGTVSVSNGSPIVTGVGTGFSSLVKPGDFFFGGANNRAIEVLSVESPTQITLAENWPFTTLTDASYSVAQGPKWGDASGLATLITQSIAAQVAVFGGSGVPADSLGVDGSVYFRSDVAQYYVKEAGVWVLKANIVGPTGPAAVITATSATSRGIGSSGTMSFDVAAGLSFQIGMRVRVAATSSPTNYMEGYVSAYSGTLLSITMDYAKGSGTFTGWSIGAAGDPGSKGDTGASTFGTSTTSLAIGTGSQTFTTQAGLALGIGSRVRIANSASNYMDGQITAYSGTSMTVNADFVAGSGTFTAWNISVVGAQGSQGTQGIQGNPGAKGDKGDTGATGAAGTNGTNGSILVATSTTSVTSATGDQTFTLAADANFLVNQRVRIASSSTPGNFMSGLVKSYNSGTKALVVTVDLLGSAPATASDWNISVTGEKGDQGPAGGFGSLTATKGNIPSGDGTTYGAVPVGADGTVPIADSTKTNGWSWQAEDAINAGPYWTASDVASAATCDIGAATTPYVRITGTTNITSLGAQPNRIRFVEFAGSLTLTYNGTFLILPGTASIITNAGDKGIFMSDASGNWRCISWTPIGFLPKEKLIANRTYYVRSDGSDSNNGLANTSAGAFATLQKAYNTITTLDLGGFTATIKIGNTVTLTTGLNVAVPPVGGNVVVQGDTSNPANTVISVTNADCIAVRCGATITVDSLTLQTTTGGYGLATRHYAANIIFGNGVRFGACASGHMAAVSGLISLGGKSYTIAGGAQTHFSALGFGTINGVAPHITLVGTPAFSFVFAYAATGLLDIYQLTIDAGTATGTRYSSVLNGVINTYGGGASYFPGSSAGSTATGGQLA